MYRNLFGIFAVFAVALVLVALTFSASADQPADLTFINGTEPKSLDPAIMTGQPEGRIADAIFEGLTYRDPKSLRPVPGSADSWEVSPDGLRYTFHIREDARWDDGTPMTAHDFVYSWRRLQEPEIASEYAYILHMIRWAAILNTYGGNADTLLGPLEGETPARDALEQMIRENEQGVTAEAWRTFVRDGHLNEALKGVEDPVLRSALTHEEGRLDRARLEEILGALVREGERRRALAAEADRVFGKTEGIYAKDDRTFVVELEALTPYFLEITAFYPTYPVPRHVIEKEGNETNWFMPGKIVSNGPFRMTDWRVNEKIRLVKSDTYWNRDAVRLDVVDALPIENVATCLNLYLAGGADWLSANYPQDLVNDLQTRSDFYKNEGLVVYYYRFNCRKKPFDDPRVRQALCMAIDRGVIVDDILRLGQKQAFHLVPPGLMGYEPPPSALRYDVEEAKRLLAAAGFPEGKGIDELGILFNTQESHRKIAENVAFQLRKNLGVNATAYNQEWQSYQQSVRDGKYDMARAGWIGDYLDPNTFLDMWVTNGGNNQTGWSDPFYDRLIAFAANVGLFLDDPAPWLEQMHEPSRARALVDRWRSLDPGPQRVAAAAAVRMQLLREAEAVLVQDAFPIMPIYFYVVSGLLKPHVRGFYTTLTLPDGTTIPNLQDIHPVRGMWLEPSEAPK